MHKSVLPNSRTLFSSGGIEIRLYDATRILLKSVWRWNCGVGNITIPEKMYASYGFQYIDIRSLKRKQRTGRKTMKLLLQMSLCNYLLNSDK